MPTYEYECNECGYRFEEFQKMSDAPLEECPECSGSVKRLISKGAGVVFKGSGFYETDYKKSRNNGGPACGRHTPCCGRDEPCGKNTSG